MVLPGIVAVVAGFQEQAGANRLIALVSVHWPRAETRGAERKGADRNRQQSRSADAAPGEATKRAAGGLAPRRRLACGGRRIHGAALP